jgi:hypothetical protein
MWGKWLSTQRVRWRSKAGAQGALLVADSPGR